MFALHLDNQCIHRAGISHVTLYICSASVTSPAGSTQMCLPQDNECPLGKKVRNRLTPPMHINGVLGREPEYG